MKLTTKAWDTVAPTRKEIGGLGGAPSSGNDASGVAFPSLGGQFRPMGGKIDPDTLRAYRAAVIWAAAAVDDRRDAVINAPWDILPRDAGQDFSGETIEFATNLLRYPDPRARSSWGSLFGPATDDFLVVGKAPILKLPGENADWPAALRALDGTRVQINPKWNPDDPRAYKDERDKDGVPTLPRYYYTEPGSLQSSGKPLSNNELMLMQPNETTYLLDGLSPMVYLNEFMHAHRDTFRGIHRVQKNQQPSGIFAVPNPQPKTIEKLSDMWRTTLQGRGGIGFVGLSADSRFIPIGGIDLERQGAFQMYDIIVRGVCAAFRISSVKLGWIQFINYSTAEQQGETDDGGILNLLRRYQHYIQTELIEPLPASENIVFRFRQLPAEQEAVALSSVTAMTGEHRNVFGANEVRIAAGQDPILYPPALKYWYEDDVHVDVNGTPVPVRVAAGLPQFQTVPGYNAATGKVEDDAAAAAGNGNGNGNGATALPDGRLPDALVALRTAAKAASTDKPAKRPSKHEMLATRAVEVERARSLRGLKP